ncbi:C-type lectin BpLec-like [Hemicordylus capensis]|uniref:C-type lectin BpLec-like n=1 Tax=Hemicordylus capensis TaxID=884348 RepID=UPI002303E2A0|nr:C-type lectin BpLec-like [Hemicordylus capensis]
MGPISPFYSPLFGLLVFSCFLQADAAVTVCPEGWMSYERNCYQVFANALSWNDAETECQAINPSSHLASILSQQEMNTVAKHISSTHGNVGYVWIGLFDPAGHASKHKGKRKRQTANRRWKWTDSSAVLFLSWAPGQPDNSDKREYCAALLHQDYTKWRDDICEAKHPYLCRFPL